MTPSLFSNTPTVTVRDNRGLTVRDIAYHRHPGSPDVTSERITRHQYNARGFLTQSADPRLRDAGLNFSYQTDLTGNVLRSQGVDNGITLALNDAADRPFLAVSNISTAGDGTEDKSQAVTRIWQYEDAELPGRPVSITEQVTGNVARVTERFVYAGNSVAEKALNLAGVCVSHYDTAGLVQTDSVALTGVPQSVTRRLLRDADNPDTVADWQGADASAWNNLLAGEREGQTTLTVADATGAMLSSTDAEGNRQRVAYDVAGMLSGSWLTVKDGTERVIVASLTYSAAGQKLREAHGNGVVTTYTYDPQTQRLTGIKTERPAGHPSGARVLQDLRYAYDPTGNVLNITNDAEETRFWRNQKVVPENTYTYDSLYQLVSATGREMAGAGQQGSHLPSAMFPFPADSAAYTNYTRTYTYDSGGNLTQIRHSAPATGNSYATNITISDRSNRGVLSTLTANPAEVDALFTAGGQQTQLLPGQRLVWTPRNELLTVTPVVREGIPDDQESYRYDGGSQRVLKVSVQRAGNSTRTQRVVYLPGLELRTTKAGDTETEGLQVITVGEAGRAQVRMLHWTSGRPEGISHDPIRYSYDNLTGSSQLELDSDGNVISMEEYYPYGGTAILTARSQTEVSYKTVRYSGKERDVTGLYYYGYRYYQPWAGRWLSTDPAGTVDGLNLFRFCNCSPVTLYDIDGRMWEPSEDSRLQPLADRLQKHNLNVFLGILGLDRERRPVPRHLAAYIISGLNNGFQVAREAIAHLEHLELFDELDLVQPALNFPAHEISDETPSASSTVSSGIFDMTSETFFPIGMNIQEKNRIDKLRRSIIHHRDGNSILSVVYDDIFQNSYYPDSWYFELNCRDGERADYYASDVAFLQYEEVSKANNFYGKMPGKIIRKNVINKNTNDVMDDVENSQLPMRQPFLWSTPNGKSTMRIMDLYGMEASKVTRNNKDYVIDVKRKISNPWRPWSV